MAHDVFISYSDQDKPIADAVCAALEATGVRCWIAPRDILPGELRANAIVQAISTSRIMVLVFSAHSNSSEDIGRELNLASDAELVILPFKIEDIEPEPGKKYYLARTHWLDAMNPPTEEQIARLVQRVASILQLALPPSIARPAPARPTPARPARRRLPMVVLAGVLLVLAVGAAAYYFRVLRPQAGAETGAIAGTWAGTVTLGIFPEKLSLTVFPTCRKGEVCATFNNTSLPCSGELILSQVVSGMFTFQEGNTQGNCGTAQTQIQARPDGTLLYLRQGSQGQIRGYLARQ